MEPGGGGKSYKLGRVAQRKVKWDTKYGFFLNFKVGQREVHPTKMMDQ